MEDVIDKAHREQIIEVVEEKKPARLLKEAEITGNVESAHAHDLQDRHGGILGALEDFATSGKGQTLKEGEFKSKIGKQQLFLDAFNLKDGLSKFGDKLMCDGKKVEVTNETNPTWYKGNLFGKFPGRFGNLNWSLTAMYDSKKHSVEVSWQMFDDLEDAVASLVSAPGFHADVKFEEGTPITGLTFNGNVHTYLHGRYTLQVVSGIPEKPFQALTSAIYAFVDEDTKKTKEEREKTVGWVEHHKNWDQEMKLRVGDVYELCPEVSIAVTANAKV